MESEHFAKSSTDHFNDFVEVISKDLYFKYMFYPFGIHGWLQLVGSELGGGGLQMTALSLPPSFPVKQHFEILFAVGGKE